MWNSDSLEPLAGRDLMAFVAAVEQGSIQGAADVLALTQSAVTKRMKALEVRLGRRLLIRGGRGVTPTAAGQALYPKALAAIKALREAERALKGWETPVLRIAASHTVGEYLLPGWVNAFQRSVQFQANIVNSPTVLKKLERSEINLGFVEGEDSLARFDVAAVAQDRLVVVVGAGHRWSRRQSVEPEELLTEPYIAREQGSGTREVAESRLRRVGVELVPRLELASLSALKRTVMGGGFALISSLCLDPDLDARNLVSLRVEEVDLRRSIYAVRGFNAGLTEVEETFWEFLGTCQRQPVRRG